MVAPIVPLTYEDRKYRHLESIVCTTLCPGRSESSTTYTEMLNEVTWVVRDALPAATTTTRELNDPLVATRTALLHHIIAGIPAGDFLNPDDAFSRVEVLNDVILAMIDRERQYEEDMRRFYQIARSTIDEAEERFGEEATEQALGDERLQSFYSLKQEFEDIPEQKIEGDTKKIFDRIRRHWRFLGLGSGTRYESWYELCTGHELRNE